MNRYGMSNDPASAIASVIASLKHDPAGLDRALSRTEPRYQPNGAFVMESIPGVLSGEQLRNVASGAIKKTSVAPMVTASTTYNPELLNDMLDAVATSRDPAIKAEIFSVAAGELSKLQNAGLPSALGSDQANRAVADTMDRLLQSDVSGIISHLEETDPVGNAMTVFSRQMLADDQIEPLRSVLGKLRGEAIGDAGNAKASQDLGYSMGSIAAGLQSLKADAAAHAAIIGKLLGPLIGKIPGAAGEVVSFVAGPIVDAAVGRVKAGEQNAPKALYELVVSGLPATIQRDVDSALVRVIRLGNL